MHGLVRRPPRPAPAPSSKIAGVGLARRRPPPRSPPRRAAAASPTRSSTSASETSQLLTTITRGPRCRAAISAGGGVGERREPQRASSASVSASMSSRRQAVADRQRARAAPRRNDGAASARPCGVRARVHVRAVVTRSRRAAPARPGSSVISIPNRAASSARSAGTGGTSATRVPSASISSASGGERLRGWFRSAIAVCMGCVRSCQRLQDPGSPGRNSERAKSRHWTRPATVGLLACVRCAIGAHPARTDPMSRRERQRRRRRNRGSTAQAGVRPDRGADRMRDRRRRAGNRRLGRQRGAVRRRSDLAARRSVPGPPSQVFAADGTSLGYIPHHHPPHSRSPAT